MGTGFASTTKSLKKRYVGGYIVQTYGSHQGRGIDAIQLEIGTKLRARANLERTATDLAEPLQVRQAFAASEILSVSSRRAAVNSRDDSFGLRHETFLSMIKPKRTASDSVRRNLSLNAAKAKASQAFPRRRLE
jgi:hypothetical protein